MSASLQALARDGWLRRVDAALGEWVARAFPASAAEVVLAAALAARAVGEGHSALQLDAAQGWLAGLDGRGEAPVLPDPRAWQAALRTSDAVHCISNHGTGEPISPKPLVLDAQGRVYLARYFGYEQRLARNLIVHACAQSLKLITGGPGTGKTHGVVRILATLAKDAHARGRALRIALAAPTGKAAARLSESVRSQLPQLALADTVAATIPREAFTLHRLLGLAPSGARPRFHRDAPLPFGIVVVDEVSMVDLPMMHALSEAVRQDAVLILLGDQDQLSAVEAGDVLGALVDAAREAPLRDCHVALTRSHRFGTDSALGELARAIARGDAEEALHACERSDDVALADNARASLVGAAADAFRPMLDASDPAAALRAARGFRVLTALRQGPSGCIALDRAIARRLQRALGVRADERWWRGRLVLITANRPELGLFNGDTGVVWPDAGNAMKVWFEGAEGVPRAFAPAALPPHEGAFALTVHKAQGSEFERVALVTGPESAVLSRELLYTGVTRARSGIVIHSTPDTLRAGIGRRTLRMSGLADRLREAAHAPIS
ncbi:MAG TPA: exodeoxyribonuclease V subunit alpha [Rhodanobacteraceae bacterium]|nr:exodeoxyribonuclease V subunit alpha [Rhodanobacteraceae bacterium]